MLDRAHFQADTLYTTEDPVVRISVSVTRMTLTLLRFICLTKRILRALAKYGCAEQLSACPWGEQRVHVQGIAHVPLSCTLDDLSLMGAALRVRLLDLPLGIIGLRCPGFPPVLSAIPNFTRRRRLDLGFSAQRR